MNTLQLHIQFFRAISVLLVFFYHLDLEFFNFGYLGVDIFFVISGFVVTLSFLRSKEKSIKSLILGFFSRRFKRLYPALLYVL